MLFLPQRQKIVILRIINRRDLERTVDRIDVRTLIEWLREHGVGRE